MSLSEREADERKRYALPFVIDERSSSLRRLGGERHIQSGVRDVIFIILCKDTIPQIKVELVARVKRRIRSMCFTKSETTCPGYTPTQDFRRGRS